MFTKREESALDRAKSDLVRNFISKHLPNDTIPGDNLILNGFHNGHADVLNGIGQSSINAK